MQVHAFRDGCPLEADKRCEPTGLVVAVGCLDYFFPYTVINRRAWAVLFEQFPGNCALREISDQVECSLSRRLTALREALGPFLALRIREDVRRTALNVGRDSHHVGMIGDDQPVEWPAELDGLAGRRGNLLAARQPICRIVPRCVAKQTGIE